VADPHPSLLPWLHLSLVPGLTSPAWRRLLAAFGSPAEVIKQSARALEGVVSGEIALAIAAGAEDGRMGAALAWARADNHVILTPEDPRYPALLIETAGAPLVLYAAGRLELLQQPTIAIVGSRNASVHGMRNAKAFARALSSTGVCVVSGLALGIDAAAHEAALGERGSTVAVLGAGIDVVYPRRNARLFDQITRDGLILSEFPLGTPPIATNFPRRNRIISGLVRGCLVVEAAMASGSLITARLAAEMGRDVFAVPGSIHSPLSRGCHHLIKQGAKLVETADDILEELGLQSAASLPAPPAETPAGAASVVLGALAHEPCDVDTLATRTRMGIDELLPLIVQLELEGWVCLLPDGSYERLK
jgi:DNA processing protein